MLWIWVQMMCVAPCRLEDLFFGQMTNLSGNTSSLPDIRNDPLAKQNEALLMHVSELISSYVFDFFTLSYKMTAMTAFLDRIDCWVKFQK